jgi:hypothetical protein
MSFERCRNRHPIRQLAKLEALLSEQPTPPPTGTTGIPDGHPRPLTAPAPDDDTPLVMRKVASDGAASANNFLNSAFGLISDSGHRAASDRSNP